MHNKICILLAMLLWCIEVSSQNTINIWEDTPVKSNVSLTYFPADPDKSTGIGIIVCPGGSYFWHDNETEGIGVAKWLQSNGISAFVLKYRVAGVFAYISHFRKLGGGNKFPYPIQDAQRAIQLVRENCKKYNIDPDKLGIMGFSAGGHLSMYAGEKGNISYLKDLGIECSVPLMPSFCVPIYPVVTLSNERYTHRRSRRALLGEKKMKDSSMRDSLSLELNVHNGLPPIFLMNCQDDPIVDYHNSELLDSALTAIKVPHKYVQYKTGGHGFGATAEKTTDEAIAWKDDFISWLRNIFK